MGGWIDIKLILSVAGFELRCQALAIHPPWKPKQVHISLITSICFRMSFIQEGQLSFSLFLSLPRSSLICFCHWTPNTQDLLNPYTILLEHGDDIYRKLVNYSHVMGAPSPTCRRSLTISLFSCGPGNRSLMDHGKFGQCLRCYLRRYLRRFRGGTRLCWWLEMLATAGKETSWNRTMSLCLWVLLTKEKPSSS